MEDPNSQMINSKLDQDEEYQELLEKYDLNVDTKEEKLMKLYEHGEWSRKDISEWIEKDIDIDRLSLKKIIKLAYKEILEYLLDTAIGDLVEKMQLGEFNN